ncbi:MAG: hypothetical protein WBN10_03610 [Polyangiales bacterium]
MKSRWMVCVFALLLGCNNTSEPGPEIGGEGGSGGMGGSAGEGGSGGAESGYSCEIKNCVPDLVTGPVISWTSWLGADDLSCASGDDCSFPLCGDGPGPAACDFCADGLCRFLACANCFDDCTRLSWFNNAADKDHDCMAVVCVPVEGGLYPGYVGIQQLKDGTPCQEERSENFFEGSCEAGVCVEQP